MKESKPASSLPFFSTVRQHAQLAEALTTATARVIHSNSYILGLELLAFEQAEKLRTLPENAQDADLLREYLTFVVVGGGEKRVLVRAVGPALAGTLFDGGLRFR